MSTMRFAWWCGFSLVGAAGLLLCGQTTVAPQATSAAKDPVVVEATSRNGPPATARKSNQGGGAVIGHLETRDRRVTIRTSPQGPRYSVFTKQGSALHRELSERELRAKAPELYDLVKTGYARQSGAKAVVVDASLRLPDGVATPHR